MNRPIRFLSVFCMLLFLALLLNLTYLQYWQSESLSNLAVHPDNRRIRDYQFSQQRGAILVRGKAIAQSVPSDDAYHYQRVYAQGPMYAAITGYYSKDYGIGGIEASQNGVLAGTDSRLFVNRVIDLFGSEGPKGGNVTLTINPRAQRAAYDGVKALGGDKKAAVVAIDPNSGRILAMASSPTYDPNELATHNFAKAKAYKVRLGADSDSPLNNRAIEEVLPPGSTFKLVTSAAAMQEKGYRSTSLVPGGSSLDLPLTSKPLRNHDGVSCGGEKITLTEALRVSCNVAYGWLGMKIGQKPMVTTGQGFGFGERYFTDLDDSTTRQAISHVVSDGVTLDKPQQAFTGIGQFDVRASALQMAMVASGIAAHGNVYKPYLVDQVQAPDLTVLWQAPTTKLHSNVLSPSVADDLTQMMVNVVDRGTGSAARIAGVQVAGKTGTAQSAPNRPPYAWFVSFAPADNPQVAVAVLVQDAGVDRNSITGNGLAAPIARDVMQAVIQ